MTEYSTSFGTDRLINRFDREPFALAFSGQGFDWLKTLRAAVAAGVGNAVTSLVDGAAKKLAPVADELAGTRPHGFDPVAWARAEENPAFDTEDALQALGVGEALVSVLDEKGVPTIVERANILPPRSSMSIAPDEAIRSAIEGSPLAQKYAAVQDRRSAYEELEEERIEAEELAAEQARLEEEKKEMERREKERAARRSTTTGSRSASSRSSSGRSRSTSTRKRQTALEKAVNKTINQTANTVGRELGKQIARGLLGNLLRK